MKRHGGGAWSGLMIVGTLVVLETFAFAQADRDVGVPARSPWSDPDPSWELGTTLTGQRYSLGSFELSPATDGYLEHLQVTLTRYFEPLRDDGAPYFLEPFLQRSSTWSLAVDGGHFATRNPFGGQDRTDWSGGVSGAVAAYVKRWLSVSGGVGYASSVLRQPGVGQTTQSLYGSFGIGLRFADTHVVVSYGFDAIDVAGTFSPLRQTLGVSVFTAIARRLTLSASGTHIADGEEGNVSLEYFATRELGIFGGAFAGKGELYANAGVPTRYEGWIGLGGWLDPTFEVTGEYELTIEDFGYREASHSIIFGFSARMDRL